MSIYLYVKTHSITGLKYLGKTTSTNPHKYPGSGTYWQAHLKKHGYLYDTEIIKECQTKEEISHWGKFYSNLWNVVASNNWANFRPESGDGGATKGMLGKKHSETAKLKISNKNKGNRHTLEAKQKIGEASKNRIVSEKTKEKHRNKVWTEKAIESRLSNCLKSAAKRKGTKNPKQSETIFINYVEKNKDLIRKIWDLYSQGNNRRQISLLLDISWDRVNLAINRKEEILKALEN